MVKKISGTGPTRPTGNTTGVKETDAVKTSQGVDSVGKVGQVGAQSRSEKIRRSTRPMTNEEREHLMKLVDEEALKLFGDGKLPEKRRRTLTESVKLTIAGGLIDIDSSEEEK